MAKKTTKKTGAKPRPGRADRVDSASEAVQLERRERALKRVLEWAWLERALDHALDHAEEGADSLASWRDPERRVAFNDRVPSCFEGEELPNVTNRRLRSVLKIAMARCPLHDLCPAPFAELSTWFCPKEAEGKWASFERSFGETETVAKFSTSLASALKLVGRLLESDLAQAKASSGKRAPVGVEREVLRVLLSSPTALDGRAIADKIGSRRSPLSEKTVWDAVARLRAECGFKIDKTGAGYKLDDRDRALAREFGISVEAVEVES
jgi:biotin operon repressor